MTSMKGQRVIIIGPTSGVGQAIVLRRLIWVVLAR